MKENKILDYEQALSKLKNITNSNTIKGMPNLATTKFGLPIQYYTAGHGPNTVVLTGSTHGSEIITTDFIIQLMENISDNPQNWKDLLEKYTFHFVPILNPEGYLISTSAIRALIPRDMSNENAEQICKDYYKLYKFDDLNDSSAKKHQELFSKIDYTCIPDKYNLLKNNIKKIFEDFPDLPDGCLQTWSANGSGIDLQANSKYNPAIQKIQHGEKIFMKSKRNNNIDYSHPGPINCPYDYRNTEFSPEIETTAISNLLQNLHAKNTNNLFIYLNYHSAGGFIYQRPATLSQDLNNIDEETNNDVHWPNKNQHLEKIEYAQKEIINYLFARLYSYKTIRFNKEHQIEPYIVFPKDLSTQKTKLTSEQKIKLTKNTVATSLNDILRLQYPIDLLIELSPMGGNPIGPYGDIENNYNNVISSNINAFHYLLKSAPTAHALALEYSRVAMKYMHPSNKFENSYVLNMEITNMLYDEFIKRVEQLNNNSYNIQRKKTNPNADASDNDNINKNSSSVTFTEKIPTHSNNQSVINKTPYMSNERSDTNENR